MSDDLKAAGTDNWAALRRPWIDRNGESVAMMDGRAVKSETAARLTKEQWMQVDAAAVRGAESRWPLVRWLLDNASKLEMDGMLQATINMEDAPQGERPCTSSVLPLPITHSDFSLSTLLPELLDTTMPEASGRRVGECVERATVDAMWEAAVPASGIQEAVAKLVESKWYGPFVVVHSGGERYKEREMLWLDLEGIHEVLCSPGCGIPEDGALVFDPAAGLAVRMVVGMPLTVVQWEDGFKTLCIVVPQVRRDLRGTIGIARCEGPR